MLNLIVRSADSADLPAIETLLANSALPIEGVGEIIRRAPEDFVVAEFDGEVVGGGALEVAGSDALLRSVFVRGDLRSAGVGRLVVERLVEQACRRGLSCLYLLTTTSEAWFPRFGFARIDRSSVPSAIGETWEFKTGCAQTAVAMAKPLTAA